MLGVICALLFSSAALANFPLPWMSSEFENRAYDDQVLDWEKQDVELQYVYNGQTMTGLPGTSRQHSASRIRAMVRVVCKRSRTCVLQMQQIEMGKLNRRVATPRHVLPIDSFDRIHIDPVQRLMLHLPVQFTLQNGLINEIVFDGAEQPWSANLKRGVLNLLQVQLKNPKQINNVDIIDSVEDQLLNVQKPTTKDAYFYKTLEQTLEGECETLYAVVKPQIFKSMNKPVYNVTKTIDFEKCQRRPQIKYNFDYSEPCPYSDTKYTDDQKFLKSSSVINYQVVKSDKFKLISNAHSESQYIFTPFDQEANTIVTYVSQNIKLMRTSHTMNRIPRPKNPKQSESDMLFSLEHDLQRERLAMQGHRMPQQQNEDDQKSIYHTKNSKYQQKNEHAKFLFKKLLNEIRHQHVNAPGTDYFAKLVNLVRTMNTEQVQQLAHEIVKYGEGENPSGDHNEHKAAKDLFYDVLGSAGTKPAVEYLVKKIERHEIPIVKAISAIKKLNSMPLPSKEIIEYLLSLGESSIAKRHYMLKQTVYLTAGSCMKTLCSNQMDQWARESKENIQKWCPTALKKYYVEHLSSKLHQSHKWDDQLIFVKALGNAGIDLSVFELEKIITNRNFNFKTLIRVESVLALRRLQSIMPKKIQRILMPIVSNRMQPEILRIVASFMILQTMPEKSVLDQLANVVQNEPSLQVATYLDSYSQSLANSTNPCQRKLADNLKLSLRQSHRVYSRPLGNSKYSRLSLHSLKQKLGVDLDLSVAFSGQSPMPRNVDAHLHANFLGFWNQYLTSLRLNTEDLEKTVAKAYRQNKLSRMINDPELNYNGLINSILGENSSPVNEHDPKAVLSLMFKNQDTFFLPLKRHALKSLLMDSRVTGEARRLENEMMEYGLTMNYNEAGLAHEISYQIPTVLGTTLLVHLKVPYVLRVKGVVKMSPQPYERSLNTFAIKADVKPSIAASIDVIVKSWSPVLTNGLTIKNKLQAFTPINAKAVFDLTNRRHVKIAKLSIKPPTNIRRLIELDTKPQTFTQEQSAEPFNYQQQQNRLIVNEEGGVRLQRVSQCSMCRVLGVKFCVDGEYHRTPENRSPQTPFAPFAGPNKLVISAVPLHSDRSQPIIIKAYGSFLKPLMPSYENEYQPWSINPYSSDDEITFGQRQFLRYLSNENYNDFDEQDSLLSSSSSMEDLTIDPLMSLNARQNRYYTYNNNILNNDRQIKKARLNTFKLIVESPRQKTTVDVKHVFNLDGDYHKIRSKISSISDDSSPFKLCLNAKTIFPTLATIRRLPDHQKLGHLQLRWGHSCSSGNYIHAVKILEKGFEPKSRDVRNAEWRKYDENSPNELLNKSPLKYRFEINYQNVPLKAKHYLNELFRFVKNVYYQQTQVAEIAVQNRPQHLKIIVAIDPVTLKKCDILVKTPKSTTLIRDVPMPSYTRPITHKRDYEKNKLKDLKQESNHPNQIAQCYASESKLKTFSDEEYRLPSTNSYHVLAKSCTSDRYKVLVKRAPTHRNKKQVKILTPNQRIVLKPSQSKEKCVKVFVNGRDHSNDNNILKTQAGWPTVKIHKQQCQVKVELLDAGVNVYYDRKSVNVEVPSQKRFNQCGACGNKFTSLSSNRFSDAYSRNIQDEESEILLENIYSSSSINNPLENVENLINENDETFENEEAFEKSIIDESIFEDSILNEELSSPLFFQQFDHSEEFELEKSLINDFENDNDYKSTEKIEEILDRQNEDEIDQEIASTLIKQQINERQIFDQLQQQQPNDFVDDQIFNQADEILLDEELRNPASAFITGKTANKRQKLIENQNSVCFSKFPIQCVNGAHPIGGIRQRVPYQCINRNDPYAQKYLNEMASNDDKIMPKIIRPTKSSFVERFVQQEVVPVECVKHY